MPFFGSINMPANDPKEAWMLTLDRYYPRTDPSGQEIPPEFWDFVRIPEKFSVYEVGDEEGVAHSHLLVCFNPPVSKQTLKNRLDKLVPNHRPRISAWKTYGQPDDKLVQYLCKGPSIEIMPNVIHNPFGYDIVHYHHLYWKVNEDLKASRKDMPLCDRVYEACEADGWEKKNRQKLIDQICTKVMVLTKGRINDHVAFPHIQSVLYRRDPSFATLEFKKRMYDKARWAFGNPFPQASTDLLESYKPDLTPSREPIEIISHS